MDEDLVALLAIPVVMFAAYVGLPLLDPENIRRRGGDGGRGNGMNGMNGMNGLNGRPPPPQLQNVFKPPTPANKVEAFTRKAAQRRSVRIGR